MRLLLINGPNLNLLGIREPGIYGNITYEDLIANLQNYSKNLGIELSCFQSNSEGQLIDRLHEAIGEVDGIILNPGALTHYSYSLRDAISAIQLPVLEVHISNIHSRESFRNVSLTAPACIGQITGLGIHGYYLAIDFFVRNLMKENGSLK